MKKDVNKKDIGLSSIRDYIRKINKPIFDKVLQETQNNHVSVGGVGFKKDNYAYYNPHNARYYFSFDKKNFNPRGSGGSVVPLKVINKGSEFAISEFFDCRIVVKRSLVEVTNKLGSDRLFKIHGSVEMRRELVVEAVATLESECIFALKKFVEVYGGDSNFVSVKVWIPDNKILHESLVDSVPESIIFRNEVVKKVYNAGPKNIEFSSPVFASNHFRNSGLYDFSPLIAEGLASLNADVSLIKSSVYTPLKESLLLKISEAVVIHAWGVVADLLGRLLVLDSVLYTDIKPLLQEVALFNGGVVE